MSGFSGERDFQGYRVYACDEKKCEKYGNDVFFAKG